MTASTSLSLRVGSVEVELAPAVGGAIAAFRVDGLDVLRPTSAEMREARNVRGYACYPLVPYSNRIERASLAFDGVRYPLARNFGDHPHAIHGVGWQRAWQVESADAAAATLLLEHDAQGEQAHHWPFPFRARQRLAVAADATHAALCATLSIENTGATPFPFGLGWHPFFPRPEGTRLRFTADRVWRTDPTRIPEGTEPQPKTLSFERARELDDVTLDDVFTGFGGHATIEWPRERRQVAIDADRALSHLVVFVPEGRDYLAVEPVTHMTDAFNRAARGASNTGTRVLPPGASFSCTMKLVAGPLPR